MRAGVVLAALAALYAVDLGGLSVVDYDEACYAEVARRMLERGEALAPELNGEPFFEKPPLLYWGQMLGYRLFGVTELGARALNTLAGLLTLLALYGFARGPLSPRVALRAVVILGTSLGFLAVARIALTDMWLTLWLVVALGCAHRALEPEGRGGWLLGAAAAAGLAMLAKGAIGLLLPGGAVLVHALWIRAPGRLLAPKRLLPALAVALGVGTSWYVLLGLTQPEGFGFMRELFLEHHVERFLEPAHSHHTGPVFTYVLVLFAGFQPWTFLLVPALARRGWPEPGAGRRLLGLFGVFALITFVFFSLAATKLPNYMTPVYPFLALMVAAALERLPRGPVESRGWRVAGGLTVAGTFVVAAVCFALPPVVAWLPEAIPPKALKEAPGLAHSLDLGPGPYVAGALFALTGVVLTARGLHRRPRALVPVLAALTVAGGLVVVTLVVPRVDAHFFRPLRRVALRAAQLGPHAERVAMVGIKYRPSTLFYGGRLTEYVSARRTKQMAALFEGPTAREAITIDRFVERLAARGAVEVLMRDTGYVLVRCVPPPGARGGDGGD